MTRRKAASTERPNDKDLLNKFDRDLTATRELVLNWYGKWRFHLPVEAQNELEALLPA